MQKILVKSKRKRDQALQDRRDIVERKVKQLNEAVDENMLGRGTGLAEPCEWMGFESAEKSKPKN